MCKLLVRAGRTNKRVFHVGLSRGKPHLANEHVVQNNLALSLDGHIEWTAGSHWLQLHAPASIRGSHCPGSLPCKANRNLFAWICSASYADRKIALKHHVIRK